METNRIYNLYRAFSYVVAACLGTVILSFTLNELAPMSMKEWETFWVLQFVTVGVVIGFYVLTNEIYKKVLIKRSMFSKPELRLILRWWYKTEMEERIRMVSEFKKYCEGSETETCPVCGKTYG